MCPECKLQTCKLSCAYPNLPFGAPSHNKLQLCIAHTGMSCPYYHTLYMVAAPLR
jgi:hypothetical protein